MATGNFYHRDSKKIYAVLMNRTDEETGEVICADDYDADDLKENLHEFLEKSKLNYKKDDGYYSDSPHSFSTTHLGTVSNYKYFGDVEVEVLFELLLTNAYYEGANLDYVIKRRVMGYEIDGEIELDDLNYSDMSKGLQTIQLKNMNKFMSTKLGNLQDKIESIFEQLSIPLVVTARFSNGETMYAKA
jgi:hypothetical protein